MKTVFETRFAKVGETSSHYQSATIKCTADACRWATECLSGYFSDKLKAVGTMLGIHVLDHIIVGDTTVSLEEAS